MYHQVFLITLAALSVRCRPQLEFFQPQRQLQFIPVAESVVLSESYVQNRADNSDFNQRNSDRRETKLPSDVNTDVFISNNLNRAEDNRNSAVTSNLKPQVSNGGKGSEFVNLSPNSTGKGIIKTLQSNKRPTLEHVSHKDETSTNNMQRNLTSNITKSNQDLYNNNLKQNAQFAENQVSRDNRTSSDTHKDNSNQTDVINPDYRSRGDIDDQNRRTVSNTAKVFNGSPNNSSYEAEGPDFDDHYEEDDRWIWGYSNVTEKGVTGTTPDVDDRANFDGGSCPTGQAKIGSKCVDKD